MKKTILAVLILLVFSCNKGDEVGPHWGDATVTLNGEPWIDKGWEVKLSGGKVSGIGGYECNYNLLDITISKFNPDGDRRANIAFSKIPPRIGNYKIYDTMPCHVDTLVGGDYTTNGSDGDVVTGFYEVLETADNQLNITSYDTKSKLLTGNFKVTFVNRNKGKRDTLRITDATFKTKILHNL